MESPLVMVNQQQCRQVASVVRNLVIRPEFSTRLFLTLPVSSELKLRMLFYSVAICHQTRNLVSNKYNLYGWEYIEKVFCEIALHQPLLLDPTYISGTNEEELSLSLRLAFSDDQVAEHSSLDRVEERIMLMKELSNFVIHRFNGSYTLLLGSTGNHLLNNGMGLYELLEQSLTFSDPARKKSSFLAKLLSDSGLYSIEDTLNYIPIMDYHMMRVLLRMGCVEITDPILKQALSGKRVLKTEEPVRQACIEAMQLISKESGVDPWIMNDIFWPLGRSCCNETTLCAAHVCMKQPCTFENMILLTNHKKCSFETNCKGAENQDYRELWEPFTETHFY